LQNKFLPAQPALTSAGVLGMTLMMAFKLDTFE
jgi:hypothetical protein